MEISDETFGIAKSNGISRKLLRWRIKDNWSLEDAVSIPPGQKGMTEERKNYLYWRKKAMENGLAETSFLKRLKKGMNLEQAATEPRKMDVLGTEKEKECRVCKVVKSVDNFRKRKTGTFDTRCKDCEREQRKKWREENQETFKAERKRNHDKYLKAKRKWDSKNKEKLKIMNRAHKTLHYNLKVGKIIKPDKCEFCGVEGKPLDGAHYDYSKPLDVKWLCKKCHAKWDYNNPKSKNISPKN